MLSNLIQVRGNSLTFQGKTYRCAVGKNGFSADKKEGDGCTPLGIFPLRECWVRADRLSTPQTKLPLRIITETDGWCDDPTSDEYNRHITLPSRGRVGVGASTEKSELLCPPPDLPPTGGGAENLWRDDHVYDLIIPLGYNDDPIIKGRGSAIFMHIAHEDYRGTEGCIALAQQDLLDLLPYLSINTQIEIHAN